MKESQTSLKIPKQLNINLMIVSRLTSQTKEQLTQKLLEEGLKPYMDKIKTFRFE